MYSIFDTVSLDKRIRELKKDGKLINEIRNGLFDSLTREAEFHQQIGSPIVANGLRKILFDKEAFDYFVNFIKEETEKTKK